MTDWAAVLTPTLGSLVGALVGGGIVLVSTRSANKSAARLAQEDRAASYQGERRERLRAAYAAALVLASAYSRVLHEQGYLMSGETVVERDDRLNKMLGRALAGYQPHEMDMVLDDEARAVYITLLDIQREYTQVQINKGSDLRGSAAIDLVRGGTTTVNNLIGGLETQCRRHLEALSPKPPV